MQPDIALDIGDQPPSFGRDHSMAIAALSQISDALKDMIPSFLGSGRT